MPRFLRVIFSTGPLAILLVGLGFGLAFMAGDVAGWIQPDYHRLAFTVALGFAAVVVIELWRAQR